MQSVGVRHDMGRHPQEWCSTVAASRSDHLRLLGADDLSPSWKLNRQGLGLLKDPHRVKPMR